MLIRPLSEKKNPKIFGISVASCELLTCKKLYYFDIASGVTVVGLGLIVIDV